MMRATDTSITTPSSIRLDLVTGPNLDVRTGTLAFTDQLVLEVKTEMRTRLRPPSWLTFR